MLLSRFGVNIGLGACFWICFAWVRVLFPGFSLLYGFFRQSVGLVLSFLLVCLTSVFTGECFVVLEAAGRRKHGKMDSQKDPWTEWCGGEAACGVLLQPKDDPGNWV